MIWLGIDLGQKGALVAIVDHGLSTDNTILRNEMPLDSKGHLNIFKLSEYLQGYTLHEVLVIFEDITTLHAASKTSNLSLGKQSGAVEGLCVALNIPFTKVPPKLWQDEMFKDLPPLRKKNGTSDTKGLAYMAAKKYFPNEKILKTADGITDALLIAAYGRIVFKTE